MVDDYWCDNDNALSLQNELIHLCPSHTETNFVLTYL